MVCLPLVFWLPASLWIGPSQSSPIPMAWVPLRLLCAETLFSLFRYKSEDYYRFQVVCIQQRDSHNSLAISTVYSTDACESSVNVEATWEQVTVSSQIAHGIYLTWDAPHSPPTSCRLMDWQSPALASVLLADIRRDIQPARKSCSDTPLSN